MDVGVRISVKGVDVQKWSANNNGPWPEDDLRALQVAVRHDIKTYIQHCLDQLAIFAELDIKVEVR